MRGVGLQLVEDKRLFLGIVQLYQVCAAGLAALLGLLLASPVPGQEVVVSARVVGITGGAP